jgi:ABC-type glutathione transport system ATPase component
MSEEGLVIDDLSISFGHPQLEVVSNLSARINSGEALGVGESGSGKSLTASDLGLVAKGRFRFGRITFEGTPLLQLSHQEMRSCAALDRDDLPGSMSSLNPVLRVGQRRSRK